MVHWLSLEEEQKIPLSSGSIRRLAHHQKRLTALAWKPRLPRESLTLATLAMSKVTFGMPSSELLETQQLAKNTNSSIPPTPLVERSLA